MAILFPLWLASREPEVWRACTCSINLLDLGKPKMLSCICPNGQNLQAFAHFGRTLQNKIAKCNEPMAKCNEPIAMFSTVSWKKRKEKRPQPS